MSIIQLCSFKESSGRGGREFVSRDGRSSSPSFMSSSFFDTIEWVSNSKAQSPTIYSERAISGMVIGLHVGGVDVDDKGEWLVGHPWL